MNNLALNFTEYIYVALVLKKDECKLRNYNISVEGDTEFTQVKERWQKYPSNWKNRIKGTEMRSMAFGGNSKEKPGIQKK